MAIVQNNQSLIDIVIMNEGSCFNSLEWCFENNISLTEEVAIKTIVLDPPNKQTRQNIVDFFKLKTVIPATAIQVANEQIEPVGIGAMILENNFIVQ